ncbi:SRR1-like protein [Pholidichthys leucotaenia]
MANTAEEWQVARRRKCANRRSKPLQVTSASLSCNEALDISKTINRIRDTVSELRRDDFWPDWKGQLLVTSEALSNLPEKGDIEEQLETARADRCQQLQCVCYGLGPFSSCVSARCQLAMLLLLLEAVQIPPKECCIYDPIFSSSEKDVLRELGLTVLAQNEEGKRLVTRPTLFYLMHCGKALYNNLLWKNWSAESLFLMVLIGNSFSGMRERTIEREFNRDYSYISKSVNMSEERQLPCPPHLIDVFSDTAVISFPSDRLNGLPQSTWAESPEPDYKNCPNLEIILKDAQS